MVIEHAERFGLAQLHQLRGRVGRGAGRSTCLLLYKGPLGEAARARLEILRETEDGFRIAEEDLRLRGEGDVLGARQAGAPGFRLAGSKSTARLLALARAAGGGGAGGGASGWRGEANRGLRTAALSVRARRGGEAAGGGVSVKGWTNARRSRLVRVGAREWRDATAGDCLIAGGRVAASGQRALFGIAARDRRHRCRHRVDRPRRQTGRFMPWGFIILFLPGIGALAYVVVEIRSGMARLDRRGSAGRQRRRARSIPTGAIGNCTDELAIVDTIANRAALAEECLALGKFEEALAQYDAILAKPLGDEPGFMLGKARAEFGLGRRGAAVATLDELKARWPDYRSSEGHLLYAMALEGAGRDDEALAAYEAVGRYYPGAEPRVRQAQLLARLGRGATKRARSPRRSRAVCGARRRTCARARANGSPRAEKLARR